nr:hypothetical protein [Paenibacillus phytorum]
MFAQLLFFRYKMDIRHLEIDAVPMPSIRVLHYISTKLFCLTVALVDPATDYNLTVDAIEVRNQRVHLLSSDCSYVVVLDSPDASLILTPNKNNNL